MAQHLSTRLVWHDRGWDGHICNNPEKNTYCSGQYSLQGIVIRTRKDTLEEQRVAGEPLSVLDTPPPCAWTVNAFSSMPSKVIHYPPDFLSNKVNDLPENIPANALGTWAYDRMYYKSPPEFDPEVREKLITQYFAQFEKGKSLVFFYLNYDNPLNPERKKYVLVGVSRLSDLSDFVRWPDMDQEARNKYGNMVWSKIVSHNYPDEGVTIPYQDYLDKGQSTDKIIVELDGDISRRFKYVSREISDDDACTLIEHLIAAIKQVEEDGISRDKSYWAEKLQWLNGLLSEVWHDRGLYPGLGSVLEFLNFENGTDYVKTAIPSLVKQGKDPRDHIFECLETGKGIPRGQLERFAQAADRWKVIKRREPTMAKLLYDRLCLFELTIDQVVRICATDEQERNIYGLVSEMEEICENPYCLCEEYVGTDPDDQIGFHRIDNGMMPSDELRAEWQIRSDDDRRIRAIMVRQLKESAANGHTYLPCPELINQVKERLGAKDIILDELRILEDRRLPFFSQKLQIKETEESVDIYLQDLFEAEKRVRYVFQSLKRKQHNALDINWKQYLPSRPESIEAEKHQRIISEQISALEGLSRCGVSILSGAAGTGKTTLLKAFIDGVSEKHNEERFLLIAPTGKAAVRLKERTGVDAKTIHRIMVDYKWMNWENFTFKKKGGTKVRNYSHIIIDESSMVDIDLLRTLFNIIEWRDVKRLTLVGDHHQLPPIGPGKPFAELYHFLRTTSPKHLQELQENCRQHEKESTALILASAFTDQWMPDVEDILNKIASKPEDGIVGNDLEVHYFQNEHDLPNVLEEVINDLLKTNTASFTLDQPWKALNDLLQIFDDDPKLSAFQILTPYRGEYFGTEALNVQMQKKFRTNILQQKGNVAGFTQFDKVIQVSNKSIPAKWGMAKDAVTKNPVSEYLANGELGKVRYLSGKSMCVNYEGKSGINFFLSRSNAGEFLELGYAISTHKAQGSEFDTTIIVLPKENLALMSKELVYTALTRAQHKTILLLQEDIEPLLHAMDLRNSALEQRNTSLFVTEAEAYPIQNYRPEGLRYGRVQGYKFRSKSEFIIAQFLDSNGINFLYEECLKVSDDSFKFPDFTIPQEFGRDIYWEHAGMLADAKYRENHQKKVEWYKQHWSGNKLIVTTEQDIEDTQKIIDLIINELDS